MNTTSKFSRIALASILLGGGLCWSTKADAAATTYTICAEGKTTCTVGGATYGCTTSLGSGGTALQSALDQASDGSTIQICPGVYRNPSSTRTIQQHDHNHCDTRTYSTSFILAPRAGNVWSQDITIRAVGGATAQQVVILGDHEHTLTIQGAYRTRISGISIVSQGGTKSNGIGDSSLNIQSATGLLEKSIITYNHTSSNKAASNTSLKQVAEQVNDQEGIQLAGVQTYFEIYDNIIAKNLHNGIIIIDGADAFVGTNLIYDNGHYGHFEAGKVGQGINVFYDKGEEKYCQSQSKPYYDPNHALKAWNNVIENNSGHGIVIRGYFSTAGVDIAGQSILRNDGKFTATDETNWSTDFMAQLSHNRVRNNGKAGIRLGHWWSYKPADTDYGSVIWLKGAAQMQLIYNDVAYNYGDDKRPANVNGPGTNVWPQGPLEGAGFMIDDIASWVDTNARVNVIDNNWGQNGTTLGSPQHSYPSHVSAKVNYYSTNTDLDPATSQSQLDQRQLGAYYAGNRSWVRFDPGNHPSVSGGTYATKMSALETTLAAQSVLTHWIENAADTKKWCEAQKANCSTYSHCVNKGWCGTTSSAPPLPMDP